MTTAVLERPLGGEMHDFDVEDIEYLRHGDKPLLARIFKPRGEGPFPALVECHGGAWCMSDRTTERCATNPWHAHGIVSIALDFRSGNEAPYPASVQDINYAVRWTKLNARDAQDAADLRRPLGPVERRASRHAGRDAAGTIRATRAIPLPSGAAAHDASVRCVVMSWPVINPLSRYRHAKRALAARRPTGMADVHHRRARIPIGGTEANMAEGNPMLALERGEKVLDRRRRSGSRAAATSCTTTRTRTRAFPATSRSALSPTTARPAARSRSTTSTGAPRRPLAGPVEDRRHVRAHGGFRAPAHRCGLTPRATDGNATLLRDFAGRCATRRARRCRRLPACPHAGCARLSPPDRGDPQLRRACPRPSRRACPRPYRTGASLSPGTQAGPLWTPLICWVRNPNEPSSSPNAALEVANFRFDVPSWPFVMNTTSVAPTKWLIARGRGRCGTITRDRSPTNACYMCIVSRFNGASF